MQPGGQITKYNLNLLILRFASDCDCEFRAILIL